MDEYTSNFLKIVIRIFQTGRQLLNLGYVKTLVDQLITGDKLLVVVNSLPLYLAIQMFFEPDQINQSESGSQSIIFKVHDVIKKELGKIMQSRNLDQEIDNPLLIFYRLKNLI